MIAAVAVADNAALATRNASDFTGLESVLEVLQL
jgi:predicted nucleic acid-binding protein